MKSPYNNPACERMLCINTRNGVEVIDLVDVVYLKADGNYTEFVTSDGRSRTYLSNLTHFEEDITALFARYGNECPYFRLSRSYLVNVNHVQSVNLSTQTVSFFTQGVRPLVISRKLLKALQTYVYDWYRKAVKMD